MLLERDVPRGKKPKPNSQWEHIGIEQAQLELFNCMDSFVYFVNTFCFIQDKVEHGWIKFLLWDEQERVAVIMQDEQRVVILKARQLGFTWLAACYAVWHMIFDPIAEILLFSKTERESKDILKRMKGIYERLPSWMKCESATVDRKLEWELSNGSRVSVLPSNAGDSYSATLIIFDESDHVQDFGSLHNRAKPAVDGGGKLFIISTSDKDRPESPFKNIFKSAWNGLTEYVGVFVAWFAHPDRDKEWYEKTLQEYIEINGSDDEFLGSYPSEPQDALKGRTLDKYFPPQWISRAYDDMKPLWIVGNTEYESNPQKSEPFGMPPINGLIIYEAPRPNVEYIIGCDPAEGGKKSNDTAITVMERGTFIEVAHLSGRIDANTTGQNVYDLAMWFNDATVMIERNNHGHTVILVCNQLGANVLFGLDKKQGWLTNVVGKPRMYDWTLKTFQQWACIVRTQKTMLQLSSIQRSTLSAPENMNDDCSDSFCLCIAAVLHSDSTQGYVGFNDL